MFKLTIFFSLFCFSLKAQNYTFNTKNDSVFYTDMVNEFYTSIGTPMCFDGTLKIHPTNKMGQYLIEVLDTVTRLNGKLNITSYVDNPDGSKEKIFIDKFSFNIKKSPQRDLYIGDAVPLEKLDTSNLSLAIRSNQAWPAPIFNITEISIILDKKEIVTLKSAHLTQTVIRKIKRLPSGAEIRISVAYQDLLLRGRRISGVYYL